MSGTLFRDIADCLFTDEDENEYPLIEISGISVSRGGTRIASTADDLQHQSLVDSTDHTATVVVYLKQFPLAVGSLGAAGAAPPRGASGSLSFTVKSADGGADAVFTLGDGANTFARFMGGGATPKHADVECAGTLTFEGYCPAGDTCPLAQS